MTLVSDPGDAVADGVRCGLGCGLAQCSKLEGPCWKGVSCWCWATLLAVQG